MYYALDNHTFTGCVEYVFVRLLMKVGRLNAYTKGHSGGGIFICLFSSAIPLYSCFKLFHARLRQREFN